MKKKPIIPSLNIDDEDIPKAAELKLTMQSNGWTVYEELYSSTREELINDIKNAALMKANDRDIAMKSYILLGFDICFGRSKAYIEDVENLVNQNHENIKQEELLDAPEI